MPPKSKAATPQERPAEKRKHESEDEHSPKRSRGDPRSTSRSATDSSDRHFDNGRCGSSPGPQLSEESLKWLEREMPSNMFVTPSDPSRQVSFSDLDQDAASVRLQKSSASNSFYRYQVLEGAQIFIHPESPPQEIRSQLDVITKRKVSENRRCEISGIAKKISQEFIYILRGAYHEDEFVELIYEAFRKMYPDEMFDCSRKTDWNPSLKPNFQQKFWDLNALRQAHVADNIIDRPRERKQGDRPIPSPDALHSSMLPPTAPFPTASSQSRHDAAVETPRPDLMIGLCHSTVASALMKRGLSEYKADDFKFLQGEDKLYSDPTLNFLAVRFPILVVEGKAYATGKTVFEAENQAAVSGSCMVNLQRRFIRFFEGFFPNSERSINPNGRKTPLAFSICTQGPIIEFWVHYFVLEEDICMHHMNLMKLCYGSLSDGLEDFFMLLERLMGWYKNTYLEEVADQLFELANHIAR